ncbi:hypothetical protein GCM10010294_52690 [Streptomyces griseoloalbus]|nr:hypothetical protein GCM10010294_52690 [Streptomyces griseoloalbus]
MPLRKFRKRRDPTRMGPYGRTHVGDSWGRACGAERRARDKYPHGSPARSVPDGGRLVPTSPGRSGRLPVPHAARPVPLTGAGYPDGHTLWDGPQGARTSTIVDAR